MGYYMGVFTQEAFMAFQFTAQATGTTDDDIICALELMIKQIQDGYLSGFDRGEDRDYSWSMVKESTVTNC
jgi:methylglyoxal synthase